MRARKLHPNFDRLDARIVLSDVSGMPTGTAVATTGGGVNIVGTIDWYIDGNPPDSNQNTGEPPIDVNYLVTACGSTS